MQTTIDTPRVRYEKRDQIAYITLDRPHVLNAMDLQMHKELAVIWDDFETDDNIRVGILSGSGVKAFSVGQDLKELSKLQNAGKATKSSFGSHGKAGWPRLTERFERIKPLIAKVQGYAMGGGFELALACDIIVATPEASFALPEAQLGLIAGAGGVFRLTRQLPHRVAMGYLLTGRRMTASQALAFGLINEVASANEIDDCVARWAEDILRSAPLSIKAIKEVVSKSASLPLAEAFTMYYNHEEIRCKSQDALEGIEAFVEQRPPIWRGR